MVAENRNVVKSGIILTVDDSNARQRGGVDHVCRRVGPERIPYLRAAGSNPGVSFRYDQLFHLADVGHVAGLQIGQQVFEVGDQFLLGRALGLIVGIVIPEAEVIVAILPVGELHGFHGRSSRYRTHAQHGPQYCRCFLVEVYNGSEVSGQMAQIVSSGTAGRFEREEDGESCAKLQV